jgi:hypothetical protein
MPDPTRPGRRRRWWRSPVRWGILAGVVSGVAVIIVGTFPPDRSDVLIPALIGCGALAGAFASARVFAMPFGTTGDPRVGGDPQPGVWRQYGLMARDIGFALGWGVLGGVGVGVVSMIADGGRSLSAFFVPFLVALVWWLAYGLTVIAILLLWIPVSICWRGWRHRGTDRAVQRAVYLLAGVLALLDLTVIGVFAVAALVPGALAPEDGRSSRGAGFFAAFRVDTSAVDPGVAVVVWATRVLVTLLMLLVGVVAVLAVARLTAARRARR